MSNQIWSIPMSTYCGKEQQAFDDACAMYDHLRSLTDNQSPGMIKQDVLMRLVAQLSHVLERVLALRTNGQFPEALAATDKAIVEFIGIEPSFLESLPLKDTLALMQPNIDLDVTRSLV